MKSAEKELRGVDDAEPIPRLALGVRWTILKCDAGAT